MSTRPTSSPGSPATATGAKEQVARLLALVPYLHARGGVRLDEAARALGVPEKQLVKDLRVLFLCGLPGGYPDDLIDVDLDALVAPGGDRVIRVANADYLSRPLRLSPTEATAIIVALRALRGGAVTEQAAEVVDRALAKLEQAAADGAAPVEVPIEPDEREYAARKALLHRALREQRQVRLSYFVPARDEESERVVDPRGVVSHRGVDYLDAYCHSAEAPRLFRLDRIREATLLDTQVASEPAAPRSLAEGLFAPGEDLLTVTLRLAPAARWVTEYYQAKDVRQQADGSLEVDLLVADLRWLCRLLLRLAPHASVVAPAEVADDLRAAAQAALRLYGPHA
jgi:proteasome accessory factor C